MSNSTPPGWYPVPGADGTPGHERWWDGNAWTSEVRPLQGGAGQLAEASTQGWQPTAPQPGYGYGGPQDTPGYGYPGGAPAPAYGYPGQDGHPGQDGYPAQGAGYGYPAPGYPPQQPAPGRMKPGVIVAIAVGVLAVGGIIAGIALSGGGSPKADPTPNPTVTVTQSVGPAPSPSPTAGTPAPTPTVPAPKPAPALKSTAPDPQHAITIPVFDGWDAATDSAHSTVFLGTGRYTCADGNSCIRGQFSVEKDTVQGTTAKAAAEAAMPTYAGQIFTGISSHTDSGSGYATVAGVFGYAVRWHIRTSDGTQGYILLAAVPAKGGGFVVFEGGVDDDPSAPDASVLDQILKGVKQDGTSGSGSTT
ncbi:DUF2510 domain-containing protein [Kitasatospora sp. NPDC087861]|uniref:DUF2510 domain-containing protein n=1 Tax=unclassified Kitasatospora TaxID=2633591 RepID=UPI002476DB8D|nr:DUF2510 domain-containing protein [Kitasatospora sp. MAA19]